MARLSGIAEIQCEKCGNSFHIDATDLVLSHVATDDDRQMGPEIFYEGIAKLKCPKCRNNIQAWYEASEYPIGVLNYNKTDTRGARVIRDFKDVDVFFENEFYSFKEESILSLPEEQKVITALNSSVTDLIHEISKKPGILYQIKPRQFEELIAHIFSQNGFKVELTKQTRDGGRDIIALRSDLGIKSKYIIECKRYAANNRIPVELVRALYGVQVQEGANKAILATTSKFTRDAHSFVKATNTTEWSIELKDFNDIYEWIKSTSQANKLLNS